MDFIKIRFMDERGVADTEFQGNIGEELLRIFNPACAKHRHTWKPPVNIYETDQEVTIVVELAGVRDEDVHLEVSHQTIKITGKRYERPRAENSRYRLAEITYGHFQRILSLAIAINPDDVTATYIDGILEIHIPKLPPDRRVRRITIQN